MQGHALQPWLVSLPSYSDQEAAETSQSTASDHLWPSGCGPACLRHQDVANPSEHTNLVPPVRGYMPVKQWVCWGKGTPSSVFPREIPISSLLSHTHLSFWYKMEQRVCISKLFPTAPLRSGSFCCFSFNHQLLMWISFLCLHVSWPQMGADLTLLPWSNNSVLLFTGANRTRGLGFYQG